MILLLIGLVTDMSSLRPIFDRLSEQMREATLVFLPSWDSDNDSDDFYEEIIYSDSDYEDWEMSDKLRSVIKELSDTHIDSIPQECGICLDEENMRMGYRLMPCEHDLMCINCVSNLRGNACPFCRTVIEDITRI